MGGKIGVYHLREFRGISSLQESTHLATRLNEATNALLRPWGGFKGIPKYLRLWDIAGDETMADVMAALNPPAQLVTVNQGTTLDAYRLEIYYSRQIQSAGDTISAINYGGGILSSGTHQFNDNDAVQFTYRDPNEVFMLPLTPATTYYVRDRTDSYFKLCATPGGPVLQLASVGNWNYAPPGRLQFFKTGVTGGPQTLNAFGNALADGDIVHASTDNGSLPAPLAAATNYYIRNRTDTTVQLSTTPSGALITFTTAGAGAIYLTPQSTVTTADGTIAVRIYKHGKNFLLFYDLVNDKCRGLFYMGDDGTYADDVDLLTGPPTFQVLARGLHETARWYGSRFGGQLMLGNGQDIPVCCQLSRTTAPGKWRLAGHNDRPAAPTVSLVAPSSATNVQAYWTIAGGGGVGQRAGAAALTFTAHSINFPGASGNNRIKVQIINGAYSSLSSSLTGTGTVADPYIYKIFTGAAAAASSNNAVVTFVNGDSKVISILSASTSAADATADTGSWAQTYLAGGSGSGASVGFANRTVTVYARYWDPGADNLGYEGISSPISNSVVIDALSAMDIQVSVVKSPGAGGGRFRYIRLYLQFGEDAEAIWLLVDPANPLDNTSTGTATYTIGSNTLFGQQLYVDQHQALESVHIVQCNGQMWRGGARDNPNRVYVSKPATEDEMAPEGANVDAYELLQAIGGVGTARITAMYSDDYRVHVHTEAGVSFIDPSNPLSQQRPALLAGAINASALTAWTGSNQFYLGSDLQLYEFNSTRYGQRDSEFAAADAAAYIAERVDRDAVHADPNRVFMFPDVSGQALWMFMPALDGSLRGFAYDFLAQGIVGPFDHPKVFAACRMEPNRPEIIIADESGNLFVWDTSAQNDHGDVFADQTAFTPRTIPDTPPVGDAGYGNAEYRSYAYRKGYVTELETGMIDLGNAAARKQFLGLVFTRIAGSRMLVEVVITGKDGHEITRYYGDPVTLAGTRCTHKIDFSLYDTALKVKFRICSEEQKPWAIRDVQLLYRAGKGI